MRDCSVVWCVVGVRQKQLVRYHLVLSIDTSNMLRTDYCNRLELSQMKRQIASTISNEEISLVIINYMDLRAYNLCATYSFLICTLVRPLSFCRWPSFNSRSITIKEKKGFNYYGIVVVITYFYLGTFVLCLPHRERGTYYTFREHPIGLHWVGIYLNGIVPFIRCHRSVRIIPF